MSIYKQFVNKLVPIKEKKVGQFPLLGEKSKMLFRKKKGYIRLKAIVPSKSKPKYTYIGDASGYIKVVPIKKKIPIKKILILV